MPVLHVIYFWTRVSAILLLGFAGMKGIFTPKVEIIEEVEPIVIRPIPTEAGFGWEKNLWVSDETITPDMPNPFQTQIDQCEEVIEHTPGMKTRTCCKIQKMKLQGLNHVLWFMRKAYSFANSVLPTFGGGAYVMILELMFGGFLLYAIKTQHISVWMLREKVYAVYNSVRMTAGQEKVMNPSEEVGKGQGNEVEELRSIDLGNAHEAERLGTSGKEELVLPCPPGERRFHGTLISQEEIIEEVGAGSGLSGSEVDCKMKKEVRFCDDSFESRLINDAYVGKTPTKVPQRRASPVKRILSEPVSKMCNAKMTRSVPAAGASAGSKSSWHP